MNNVINQFIDNQLTAISAANDNVSFTDEETRQFTGRINQQLSALNFNYAQGLEYDGYTYLGDATTVDKDFTQLRYYLTTHYVDVNSATQLNSYYLA